jgi:hypothetical protein
MLTFIFLFFLAIFGVAAYFISIKAKRRTDGSATRPPGNLNDHPTVGRATGGGDD